MTNYSKIKASTQEHLDIEDITEDLVILKTGWVALVMITTAVNFDILSEAEQDATIYAYGALLNSLSFPIETLIRSKKADITSYFLSLSEAERNQTNPDLKRQIQKYQDFIQSTVQQKTVLDKKFYLIINYSSLERGPKIPTSPKSSKSKAQLVADAKIALMPKRDHLVKQTARLGLSTRQLTTQELIELFYDIYNPAPIGTQRVFLDSASYTVPLVEPAVEVPTPAPPQYGHEQLAETKPSQNQPEQPISPEPTPPQPVTTQLPTDQAEALRNLQEAASKAVQFVSQTKTTPFVPPVQNQPINTSPDGLRPIPNPQPLPTANSNIQEGGKIQ